MLLAANFKHCQANRFKYLAKQSGATEAVSPPLPALCARSTLWKSVEVEGGMLNNLCRRHLGLLSLHSTSTPQPRGTGRTQGRRENRSKNKYFHLISILLEASRFLKNATPTPGGLRPAKGVGISESAAIPAPYKLSYP